MFDPVVQHVAAAALAIVFLVGAIQKVRDWLGFEMALENYELLPLPLVKPLALVMPAWEAAAALLLIAGTAWRTSGALAALALLGVVTGAIVINLLRGRTDVGCGCGGVEDEQTLSWGLVARNAVLGVLALVALAGTGTRELTWLDGISVAAGAICLYGLYVLANQLMANAPRLEHLRAAS